MGTRLRRRLAAKTKRKAKKTSSYADKGGKVIYSPTYAAWHRAAKEGKGDLDLARADHDRFLMRVRGTAYHKPDFSQRSRGTGYAYRQAA